MSLPTFLRFKDLKARGIVQSWPQLGRLIRDQGFPLGTMLGVNTRAWTEDEVAAWLASRPQASPLKIGDEPRAA